MVPLAQVAGTTHSAPRRPTAPAAQLRRVVRQLAARRQTVAAWELLLAVEVPGAGAPHAASAVAGGALRALKAGELPKAPLVDIDLGPPAADLLEREVLGVAARGHVGQQAPVAVVGCPAWNPKRTSRHTITSGCLFLRDDATGQRPVHAILFVELAERSSR